MLVVQQTNQTVVPLVPLDVSLELPLDGPFDAPLDRSRVVSLVGPLAVSRVVSLAVSLDVPLVREPTRSTYIQSTHIPLHGFTNTTRVVRNGGAARSSHGSIPLLWARGHMAHDCCRVERWWVFLFFD